MDVGMTSDPNSKGVKLARRIFLTLGCPTLLLFCFLIGPFEASDEASHFRRIAAIADGQFLPKLSPAESPPTSAGGIIDRNSDAMLRGLDDVVRDPQSRFSRQEMKKLIAVHQSTERNYAAHSNTAIYPPFLYMPAASVFVVARHFDLPVLMWLYLGRLANAIVAAAIVLLAIRRSDNTSLFVITVAMLPLILFQEATLSADALLLPLFLLFGVYLAHLGRGTHLSRRDATFLAITSFILCTGKVAYLPLGLLPPLASWLIDRRSRGQTLTLLVGFIVSVIAWAAWAAIVHDKIFSIRPNVVVDSSAQLAMLLRNPYNSVLLFGRSLIDQAPNLLIGMVGRRLGWQEIVTPLWFVVASLVILPLAALYTRDPKPCSFELVSISICMGVLCIIIIFVLLYLQYNAVGSLTVEGVQGRYLTPLLMIFLCLVPRVRCSHKWLVAVRTAVIAWAVIGVCETAVLMLNRYWLPLT